MRVRERTPMPPPRQPCCPSLPPDHPQLMPPCLMRWRRCRRCLRAAKARRADLLERPPRTRVGCHIRRARALAAGEACAASGNVGSVRHVRGAPSMARGVARRSPRGCRSRLYGASDLFWARYGRLRHLHRPRGGRGRAEGGQAVAHSHAGDRRSGGGASYMLPWPPIGGFALIWPLLGSF